MSSVPAYAQLVATGMSLPPTNIIERRFQEAGQPGVEKLVRQLTLQTIEADYLHLPPLPSPLTAPTYLLLEKTRVKVLYRKDETGTSFYCACADGDLERIKELVSSPFIGTCELEFGLEEAFLNFQIDVIEFLLKQTHVKLHYRCFRRGDGPLEKQQSIFTSGSPKLQGLLQSALRCGWHPNQLLGPPTSDHGQHSIRQHVALHYPRCILDTDILRLLLDAGADPTIASHARRRPFLDVKSTPVQRLSSDVLEMAVNIASVDNVELLFEYGATACPEYGMPLHCLVRRRPDPANAIILNDALVKELCTKDPEDLDFPTLDSRFLMAELLIKHGADVNAEADVFRHVGRYTGVSCTSHSTPPILHAKHSADWDMVKLLLVYGADAELTPIEDLPLKASLDKEARIRLQQWLWNYSVYRIEITPAEIEKKFNELIMLHRME